MLCCAEVWCDVACLLLLCVSKLGMAEELVAVRGACGWWLAWITLQASHTAGATHCMCGRGATEGALWDNDMEADGY